MSTELERAAGDLMARGVNVIPLRPRDKRPAEPWERWTREGQLEALTDADGWTVERWRHADHGLGAVTGRVSGIVVVDLDSPAAEEAFRELVGDSETVFAITAKGSHVWFAYPDGVEIRNRVRLGGLELDVRGDGGYVVCPPSIHPSGVRYRWHVAPAEAWPPAPVPPALLELVTPEPVTHEPRRLPDPPRVVTSYVAAAVRRELEAVARAPVGERNDTLNRAAYALARFVSTGHLAAAIADDLVDAGALAGLDEREARATVRSAFASRGAA